MTTTAAAVAVGPIYHVALPGACVQAQSDLLRSEQARAAVLESVERRSGDQNARLERGPCGSAYTVERFSRSGVYQGDSWRITVFA